MKVPNTSTTSMNLQPVTGTNVFCTCASCGKFASNRFDPHKGPGLFADLNGEPFKAYYCRDCVLGTSK